ncbi:alpha/beta hydrolase [Prochlorococcus sp. AH-716-I09]|nr:alpha/beta hydrolase [Prochlorococcus sp. AH-716-I09]
MRNFFIIFLGFCGLFLNNGLRAAEKINIRFEEMTIPLTIDQLSKLEKYKEDSTELIDWLKNNGFQKVFELSKFMEFPVFEEEGLNRELLRSWIGRKILTELSKTIEVPNDNNGIEIYNTIENLLEDKKEVSTLDIIKALPSEEIYLDIDNLILIIKSWKNELALQQDLISKLNNLEKSNYEFFKNNDNNFTSDLIKLNKKIYAPHRVKPLEIELWKTNKTDDDKKLIIFMPGLGGEINNFKWIGNQLTRRGWPVAFIDHRGSNLKAFLEVLEGKEAIPGSADFFLYRIKDLDALLKVHKNGEFGLPNDSYILMGHSLGALIALLYEGNKPTEQLKKRCDSALKDFALTNVSKLLQCQLNEIPFSKKNTASGINVSLLNLALSFTTALVIVSSMSAVGVILVIALLSTPTLLGLNKAHSLRIAMIRSSFFGLCISVLGFILSIVFNLSPGPAISVICVASLLIPKLRK